MADTDLPPQRRWRMTIEADGDDTEALALALERVEARLWESAGLPIDVVSGGGWSLRVEEVEGGLTGEAYDAALVAWWERRKEARRG